MTIRTTASVAATFVLVAATWLLGGCSTEASTGPCDDVGVEREIDHMVSEAGLHIESLDDLVCAGSWAYAQATISDAQAGSSSDSYLFERDGGAWILRDPVTACGTVVSTERPADSAVPAELFVRVCLDDAGLLPS